MFSTIPLELMVSLYCGGCCPCSPSTERKGSTVDPFDYRAREEAEVKGEGKRHGAQHCLFHNHSASLFGALMNFMLDHE